MRRFHHLVALAAALTLGACTAAGPAAPGAPAAPASRADTAGACGDSAAQAAVGATAAEAEPILRRASEAVGGTYRVVKHDQVITMEYRGDRLTARVGRDGRVESVACG